MWCGLVWSTVSVLWCAVLGCRPRGGGGATTTGADATPPPAICQNLWGEGGYWQLGRGGGGGCAQPTTITCIPQGGVWGHGVQRCVCHNSDILSLPGRKS